ncbi:unnamed protein product, partial [Cyprideis torosa]
HHFLCHPTSLTKWRQRLGEAGCESLLAHTNEAGLKSKAIKRSSLDRVVVDATVAHEPGIGLRQTYEKAGRALCFKVGRYGHARQFKRLAIVVNGLDDRVNPHAEAGTNHAANIFDRACGATGEDGAPRFIVEAGFGKLFAQPPRTKGAAGAGENGDGF